MAIERFARGFSKQEVFAFTDLAVQIDPKHPFQTLRIQLAEMNSVPCCVLVIWARLQQKCEASTSGAVAAAGVEGVHLARAKRAESALWNGRMRRRSSTVQSMHELMPAPSESIRRESDADPRGFGKQVVLASSCPT